MMLRVVRHRGQSATMLALRFLMTTLCAAQAISGDRADVSSSDQRNLTDSETVLEWSTDPAPPPPPPPTTEELPPAGAWRCPSWCFCDEGLEWTAECTRAEFNYSAAWQPGDYVKLTCLAPRARRLAPADLPALFPAQGVPSAGLYSCELQAAAGAWAAALRALGVSNTTRLTLQAASADTLTAEALRGLEALDMLTIRDVTADGPWTPPRDLLAATPALRRFTVRGSSVRLEAGGLAAAPASMHTLELAEGHVELMAGAFRGLRHVRRLLLWRAGLTALPAGALDGMDELEELELTGNALVVLESGALSGAPRLQALHVAGNPLARVEAGALPGGLAELELWRCAGTAAVELGAGLAGLAALRAARLDNCRLRALSPRLLQGATSLQNLSLVDAGLASLPLALFADTRALERLDLSHNHLQHLPAGTFASLTSLRELNLDWNRIHTLSEGSLTGLSALTSLSMRSCGLLAVRASALTGAPALTHLRLDNNSLTLQEDSVPDDTLGTISPLHSLHSLVWLSLAHNLVSTLFADWLLSLRLERLDLAYNRLDYLNDADLNFFSPNIVVDLRNNNISTVRLVIQPPSATSEGEGEGEAEDWWRPKGGEGSGATLLLDDNPYLCDCRLEGLVRRVRAGGAGGAGGAGLRARGARCAAPAALAGRALADVEPRALTCRVPAPACPGACACLVRPAARALELACRSLPAPAALPAPPTFGLTHSSVRLLHAPPATATLHVPAHVTLLDLSALNLTEAPTLWLPAASLLATLDLRHNALAAVPEQLLRVANTSRLTVLLAGNPIRCPCEAHTIQLINNTVGDWSGSQCIPGACASGAGAVLGALLALCGAGAAAAAALYVRYRRPARAFLVARGLWPAAGGGDDDKAQYDAFVSYSHEDDEWVSGVARGLEAGGVRLCLHARDWVPGDWIPAQIARSVEAARRTLLVVSPAWARSRWARAEWAAAHAREVRSGRAHVLVLLLAERAPADLPAALRAHLAARTYLAHSDARLPDKLRAALLAPLERARPLPPPPPPPPPPLVPDKLDARY